jgi:hypothetical protein
LIGGRAEGKGTFLVRRGEDSGRRPWEAGLRLLQMATKREYDLKAVGWARTVSGFQSLLSVYLIALWVLTYFGRPFG